MALLQISEPGQSPVPHQFKRVAGIDLGTTNSLVATVESGEAAVILDENGDAMLPSVIHFAADGHVDVGYSARAMATHDAKNTLASFKRWLGRAESELNLSGTYDLVEGESVITVATTAGAMNAIQASSIVLENLARRAESRIGGALEGVVITVPAYFDDSQRQSTRDAARLAGLNVLRLINEPTAAAVAYGLDKADDRMIAVYDLGGGTFDISILQLSEGVFEVIATGGDSALGGDDFDAEIAGWIATQAGLNQAELSAEGVRLLQQIARDAKQQLSQVESCEIEFGEGDQEWHGTLTRQIFNQLITSLVGKTLDACKRCLTDAELDSSEIADVVMVGGSTRVPLVRQEVAEFFGQPVKIDVDPDQVVAIGAAIQADILAGNKRQNDLLLLDVTPLSLGLEMYGGLVEKIVPRNTPIPVAMAQEFTTAKDGQTALSLHVMQGERERVEHCRSLAKFQLSGIPPMVAGAAKIRVTFSVNADGILNVSAEEVETGVHAAITVEPANGLNESQITDMLRSSFQHAEADKQSRMLIEQQVEARALLDSVLAALANDADLLSEGEYERIEEECQALQQVLNESDVDRLRNQTTRLATATDTFAARRMDKSIKQALQGKSLEDMSERI